MLTIWLGFAFFYLFRIIIYNELLDKPSEYCVCKITSLISNHQFEFGVDYLCQVGYSLYYSAITFLTIGYGDIYPSSPALRIASGIEGFLGLFLMAVFTVSFMRKVLR